MYTITIKLCVTAIHRVGRRNVWVIYIVTLLSFCSVLFLFATLSLIALDASKDFLLIEMHFLFRRLDIIHSLIPFMNYLSLSIKFLNIDISVALASAVLSALFTYSQWVFFSHLIPGCVCINSYLYIYTYTCTYIIIIQYAIYFYPVLISHTFLSKSA